MRLGLPRATTILVALAAATVAAFGLSGIRGILAPTLLTLVLVICANPVRIWLLKRGVAGGLATGSVILVVFGLLAGFTYTIVIAFAQFVEMLPTYSTQFARSVPTSARGYTASDSVLNRSSRSSRASIRKISPR